MITDTTLTIIANVLGSSAMVLIVAYQHRPHNERPIRTLFQVPKEECHDNVKSWDTNLLKANDKFLSLNWQAAGGGAFALIPQTQRGKLPELLPLCRGHTSTVLDTDFSPFDDTFIASGGDDANISLWNVTPEVVFERMEAAKDGNLDELKPMATFQGGRRRVGHVLFHPTASNVLAAATGDPMIKLFDVETQKCRVELTGFTDAIQSMSFDATGSTIAATCRDRKLRLFDTRAPQSVQTVDSHGGIKGARVVWCGDRPRLITTGFSKLSERQMFLWDVADLSKPIKTEVLDNSNGIIMPFWTDNNVIFLAGKGDGNIRYYELENDELHYLSEYKSVDPQTGMAMLPRRDLNVDENEIARVYKVTNSMIQPVSFYVPRKSDSFQADIFPPALSSKPAMTAVEFFDEKKTIPPNMLNFDDRSITEGASGVAAAFGAASASEGKKDEQMQKSTGATDQMADEANAKADEEAEGKSDKEAKAKAAKEVRERAQRAEKEAREKAQHAEKKAREKAGQAAEQARVCVGSLSKGVKDSADKDAEEAISTAEKAAEDANARADKAAKAANARANKAVAMPTADAPNATEDLKAQLAERDTRIRELEMELTKLRTNQQRFRDIVLNSE
ncbi:Crn1p [Malassezia vespertilionis]|uniref:Coronin n=1 Tax=Malassezia vespertilionis TaxID=2020962 RepID=A0A2N1JHJ2_9BASI|nr:Crn1p [Malassezia vespertilionis]